MLLDPAAAPTCWFADEVGFGGIELVPAADEAVATGIRWPCGARTTGDPAVILFPGRSEVPATRLSAVTAALEDEGPTAPRDSAGTVGLASCPSSDESPTILW